VVDLIELKQEVKRLEQEKEQAKGRVSQLLKTLKEKYKCSTVEEAKELLKKKRRELKKLDAKYQSELSDFMEEWGEYLQTP